jgi:hypothetical protein
MRTTSDILESIEIRLRELKEQIAALEAARGELNQAAPPAARATDQDPADGRARRPDRRRRRPRRTRSAEVVPAEKLELLLSRSDGLTTTALAQQAGGDRDQVITLLRELEAAGRVRRSGQRRGTRWHAITEEDWIRERAKELAARSAAAQ